MILLLKKFINNCLKKTIDKKFPTKRPVDTVKFLQNKVYPQFELFVDYEKYDTGDPLWRHIQRDIIRSITEDFFVVAHLLSSQTDIYGCIEELDEGIGSLYPYQKNEKGEYFIEVMPHDRRLLTKIQDDDLLWECGYLLHIAVFREKQDDLNSALLDSAEFVIHSFYDNIGFEIDVNNIEKYSQMIREKISYVLENYHIVINK